MGISRLMVPAVTLAGALALAACGGGNGNKMDEKEEMDDPSPSPVSCNADGSVTAATSAGCKAALDAAGATEAAMKERTDTAKALKTALGTGFSVKAGLMPKTIPAQTGNPASKAITLKETSATVSALGDWKGAEYEGRVPATGTLENTGKARIYSNKETGKPISFAAYAAQTNGLTAAPNASGGHPVAEGSSDKNIGGTEFPSSGLKTFTGAARKFTGTYNDVSGTYECTGNTCTAEVAGEGITLVGMWTFTPPAGATVQTAESNYLYFGWWSIEDKDGDPVRAFTHYHREGGQPANASAIQRLQGKATYKGKAAGLYAIHNRRNPAEDDSGHFTADASLSADFGDGTANGKLSGSIENFRLKDGSEDPGWKVTLKETSTYSDSDSEWTDSMTQWDIGDAEGDASGTWEARMYGPGSGSSTTTPDFVAGSFHSEFESTHEMRGAFGTELE